MRWSCANRVVVGTGHWAPTLHVVVRLPAGDPLATLKPPVVWIRQHHFHKHVVMRRHTETNHVKAEEREHPPAHTNTNNAIHQKRQSGLKE